MSKKSQSNEIIIKQLGKLSPDAVDAVCQLNPKMKSICEKNQTQICQLLLNNHYKWPGLPLDGENPCHLIKALKKYMNSKGEVDFDAYFVGERGFHVFPTKDDEEDRVRKSKSKSKSKSKNLPVLPKLPSVPLPLLPSVPLLHSVPLLSFTPKPRTPKGSPPKTASASALASSLSSSRWHSSLGFPQNKNKKKNSPLVFPDAWKNPFVLPSPKRKTTTPSLRVKGSPMNWSPTLPRPPLSVQKVNKKRNAMEQRKYERIAACVKKNENITEFSRKDLKMFPIQDINKRSPKLSALFDNIEKLNRQDHHQYGHGFKHYVFVNNKNEYGIRLVIAAFTARPGYNLLNTPKKTLSKSKPGQNNFGFLASSLFNGINYDTQKFRKEIMAVYNERPGNIYGENMNIIILDSGFKEGIDLFDVKYVHIFDELKNDSETKQAVGRALRFCGQKGLPYASGRGWSIDVFNYKLQLPEKISESSTAGTLYWDVIDDQAKYNRRLESYIENILDYVSII